LLRAVTQQVLLQELDCDDMKYGNSGTFKDLLHQIPKLLRPCCFFKDFPGAEKWMLFQALTRKSGHPVSFAHFSAV